MRRIHCSASRRLFLTPAPLTRRQLINKRCARNYSFSGGNNFHSIRHRFGDYFSLDVCKRLWQSTILFGVCVGFGASLYTVHQPSACFMEAEEKSKGVESLTGSSATTPRQRRCKLFIACVSWRFSVATLRREVTKGTKLLEKNSATNKMTHNSSSMVLSNFPSRSKWVD